MATETVKSNTPQADGVIASLTSSSPTETCHVTWDIAPAAIFKILLTLGSIWLVIRIFPVLILIVFSLMLVATFVPLVRRMQARMRRSWAVVGIVSGIVVLFLGTLALLIPALISQAMTLYQRVPHYAQQLQAVLSAHHIHIPIQKQVDRLIGDTNTQLPEVMNVLSGAVNGITAFATVAILTIYLLIEGPQVSMSLMRLLPRKERLGARKLVMEIGTQVGHYMRGQIITSALAGVFSFVTLWLVGVPGALALGALAAIADAIPLIGVLIALLPAALMALTISPAKAGIVIVAYVVYHQLEDYLIAPKVYGKALGLSLSVIVISLLIGVELLGMVGAVLALPVAAAIPTIMAYIQEWQETHGTEEPEGRLP